MSYVNPESAVNAIRRGAERSEEKKKNCSTLKRRCSKKKKPTKKL